MNSAVKHKDGFSSFRESTFHGSLSGYFLKIKANVLSPGMVIYEKRGQSLYLHDDFDKMLCAFIAYMQMTGETINYNVGFGV